MKTLWILAAAATFAACSSRSEEDVGAAPDRGDDTTAVTTEVDTSTGQWDTTSTTGDVNAPSDTALTPTTPTEAIPDTSSMGTDTTMTLPDTGAYVPDTSSAGIDTSSTGAYDPWPPTPRRFPPIPAFLRTPRSRLTRAPRRTRRFRLIRVPRPIPACRPTAPTRPLSKSGKAVPQDEGPGRFAGAFVLSEWRWNRGRA